MIETVLNTIKSDESAAIGRLCDWLKIPSISTDPAYAADVRKAGEWARDRLAEAGFEVEIRETGTAEKPGHPIVLAKSNAADGYDGPRILFYGHYDVQPADPVELWKTAPFEPEVRTDAPGERVVARGACDDKGQVATFLEAVRAWHAASGHPTGGVPYTVLLEGEEESGSANLEKFLDDNADEFRDCAVCLISDTAMLARERPAITCGVRGLTYTEITLHGPDQDLHSGAWGGKVPNPINELTKVLAQLWDEDRRVTIPGFYDAVVPIADRDRQAWRDLGVDPAQQLKGIGLGPDANVGESDFEFLEREWARPTCDINGIVGGYTGHGAKTVIPSHASAKVSFRLVADQDPDVIRDAFFDWLDRRTPPGCRWDKVDHGGGHPASVDTADPMIETTSRAIEKASGVRPELIKTGGSIPIAGQLKAMLGLETVFMGFGLEDDRVHSPNEKFELGCFRLGMRSHAHLIEELRQSGGIG